MTQTRYLDLANLLEREVADAEPGTALPSEHELADRYGVNRQTARAALRQLEARHLVTRIRGRGTFVADRLPYRIGATVPPSITRTLEQQGRRISFVVQRLDLRSVRDVPLAADLGLDLGGQVVELVRVGLLDSEPVLWTRALVPAERLPSLDVFEEAGSLYDTLTDALGQPPTRGWVRVELAVPPATVANAIGMPARPPCWRVDSVNCDRDGRPVDRSNGWMRPDRFAVVLELDGDTERERGVQHDNDDELSPTGPER